MTLTPGLLAALERFVAHERVLVALDFDGTLAPEVDDPAHARALSDALDALARLHTMPGVTLALISGRSLASLAAVSELPADVPLVGSHGLELRWMAEDAVPAINDLDHQRVAALHARLAPLVGQVDGAWIERKPAGLAVHTRLVEPTAATALQRTVRDAVRAFDGNLTVRCAHASLPRACSSSATTSRTKTRSPHSGPTTWASRWVRPQRLPSIALPTPRPLRTFCCSSPPCGCHSRTLSRVEESGDRAETPYPLAEPPTPREDACLSS